MIHGLGWDSALARKVVLFHAQDCIVMYFRNMSFTVTQLQKLNSEAGSVCLSCLILRFLSFFFLFSGLRSTAVSYKPGFKLIHCIVTGS